MKFFNLHTHNFTNAPDILEMVNQYPATFDVHIPYYSIGIHPWKIDENTIDAELAIIASKLELENCLAVGECGLDKRIYTPFDVQIPVLERQLLLAEKYGKPAVIHCVAAFQELIEIKNRLEISVPMIIHGFSKSAALAKQLLENGFYLSFGKYLMRNPELEAVFKSVPDDRFFLETDTIEEGIREVYALAATYKKISLDELKQIINANFRFVFTNNK